MHIQIVEDDMGDVKLVRAQLNKNPLFKRNGATFGCKYGMEMLRHYNELGPMFQPNVIVLEAKYSEGNSLDLIRFAKSSKKLKHINIVIYEASLLRVGFIQIRNI